MQKLFDFKSNWEGSLAAAGYMKRWNDRQKTYDFVRKMNKKRNFPRFHIYYWKDNGKVMLDLHYDHFPSYHNPLTQVSDNIIRTTDYRGYRVEKEMNKISNLILKH